MNFLRSKLSNIFSDTKKLISRTIALLRSAKFLTFFLRANHLVTNGVDAATAVLAVA